MKDIFLGRFRSFEDFIKEKFGTAALEKYEENYNSITAIFTRDSYIIEKVCDGVLVYSKKS